MSPLLPADWRKTEYTHRIGTRAAQPDADTVTIGTLYFVTDEFVIERSNGATWDQYSGIPDPLTVSKVIGGTGATDGLSLQSTSGNGTSRTDYIKFLLGNNGAQDAGRIINNAGAGFLLINETALKYTGLASAIGGVEIHVETDVNFAITSSIDIPDGLAFQGYNDAVNANVGFEFRGKPIGFTIGLSVFSQHFARSGRITPSQLGSGNTNNWSPSGLGGESATGAYAIKITGANDNSSVITGIDGGLNYNFGGRELLLICENSPLVTIGHQDTNSDADNRIISPTGANVVLSQNDNVTLWYDQDTARWRMVSICQ